MNDDFSHAREGLEGARAAVADTVDRTAELGRAAALRSTGYVGDHPLRSIGIAAAAGWMIGWMMSRR